MGRHPCACWRAARSTQIGWLDQFFHGYETILNAGQLLLARAKINLVTPLVATDDATNKWTSISISAASDTTAGTLAPDDYKKIQSLAPGSNLPLIPAVVEPPSASLTASLNNTLAFAPLTGSSLITSAKAFSAGVLIANDTNYRTVDIYDVSPSDVVTGPIASATTQTSGSGGTGDWAAGVAFFTWTPVGGYTLAAGHRLLAAWGKSGAGVAFPGTSWRFT